MAPSIKDSNCLAHSGVVTTVESNGVKLDEILEIVRKDSKRLDTIYTVVGVLSAIGGAAWAFLILAVKQGWLV